MGQIAIDDLWALLEMIRSISGLLAAVAALTVLCEIVILLGSLISLQPRDEQPHRN